MLPFYMMSLQTSGPKAGLESLGREAGPIATVLSNGGRGSLVASDQV